MHWNNCTKKNRIAMSTAKHPTYILQTVSKPSNHRSCTTCLFSNCPKKPLAYTLSPLSPFQKLYSVNQSTFLFCNLFFHAFSWLAKLAVSLSWSALNSPCRARGQRNQEKGFGKSLNDNVFYFYYVLYKYNAFILSYWYIRWIFYCS